MYKVFYKDEVVDKDNLENIDSVAIDVSDINNMKYVDIIYKGDINLLILYVRCLKYYHHKLDSSDRFVINNNFKDNKNIVRSILNCDWLINEDDVILNIDKLENIKNEFQEEIDFLKDSKALKDIHRVYLKQYFIDSLEKAKEKIGNYEKKYVKKGR